MKPIQVGLMGLGTVGGGVFEVLKRNREEIKRRAGRDIELAMVSRRDVAAARALVGGAVRVVADAREIIANPEIDIVVELIGGYGIARALVMEAIAAGKHVVTANKALLAVHGTEIFAAAREKGVVVAFEAAVAGGIPIIKSLREGLTANRIEWIAGIVNGTTNFILSEMRDKGLDFDAVLKQAQALGYAEAGRLEYPNLVVTLAESEAGPFFDWAESFIIQGVNGQKDEKSGSIDFLTVDLKTVLATLTFSNLGIFRCAPEKAEAGVESIRRVKAEMYCESMTFSMPAP